MPAANGFQDNFCTCIGKHLEFPKNQRRWKSDTNLLQSRAVNYFATTARWYCNRTFQVFIHSTKRRAR